MKVENKYARLISKERPVASLRSAIFECLVYGMGEINLMLCNRLTVLHTHSFSHILTNSNRMLAAYHFIHAAWSCNVSNFSHPLSRGSFELRPCDRCFGPEWFLSHSKT